MYFKEVLKCGIVKYWMLMFVAIDSAADTMTEDDNNYPANKWVVIRNEATDLLNHVTKIKRTFSAVLFRICNFCS